MSLSSFPRTFHDAIRVCKGLCIEYLWIDSLCIIQDSLEDWNEQSSKMSELYSRAWITIAADAASSIVTGFLDRESKADTTSNTEVPGEAIDQKVRKHCLVVSDQGQEIYPGSLDTETPQSPPSREIVVFSRPYRKLSTADGFSHHYDYSKKAPVSHLSNREWTFQETLLSPRILHFMPEEMTWQCATLCRCECRIQS